jgi:hypothetical protein
VVGGGRWGWRKSIVEIVSGFVSQLIQSVLDVVGVAVVLSPSCPAYLPAGHCTVISSKMRGA